MFLIKAGDLEKTDSKSPELKAQSQDFQKAKRKAYKLLESFTQVEIIDSVTNQCVYYESRDNK